MTPPMYPGPPVGFDVLVGDCAEDIRAGRINTVADIQRIWALGSEITALAGGQFVNHTVPLDQSDAELVWQKSVPEAWVLTEEEVRGLNRFNELFAGKVDELDPGIPLEFLQSIDGRPSRVERARFWIIHTLGLTDRPYSFNLDELAKLADARLGLHYELTRGGAEPPVEEHPPVSKELVIPTQRSANLRPGVFDPTMQVSKEIRSHRRPERRGRRIGLILAAGAVALISVFAPTASDRAKTVVSPTTIIQEQSPQIQTPPAEVVPDPDTMERIIPIASYDPDTRTGAIWFQVEDYAAELGHPKLTMLQTHRLTQKTLDYMNTRLPGGMSWSQALEIPTGAQLPYPPARTMRAWIQEVTAVQTQ